MEQTNETGSSKVRAGSSIADELRKWNTGRLRPDHTAELDAIADSIDEQYYKTCRALDSAWSATSHEVLEQAMDELSDEWVKLPVDADGEPIHIGDVVIYDHDGVRTGTPETVKWIAMGETEVHISTDRTSYAKPSVLRHYHAPTVEDVLREFADRVCNSGHQWGLDAADVIAEYAAKLRLAGEGE